MKKNILALLLSFISFAAFAQYGGHDVSTCSGRIQCTACFGTGVCYGYTCATCGGTGVIACPMCAGYRAGQRAAEQVREARWEDDQACLQDGISELLQKRYSKALRFFKRSARLGNGQAMSYLGIMYELGLGDEADYELAKMWYDRGASKDDLACINSLKRIRKYGYFEPSASNRRIYISNLRNIWNMCGVISQQIVNSMHWSTPSKTSGSSSSSKGPCRSCGGTGVNSAPNPGGSHFTWVAHYNSDGEKCKYCGRYTSHFHDRCPSCNVPNY